MDVSEVCEICRELNSEKTTERKKAAEKLKLCLGRASIKKALDRNFLEGRGSRRNFTWENVFRAVCIFVAMETGDLKNASTSASKTTLTNRETRKLEASGLMKFVVRLADKGGPKLKGSLFCENILETLRDEYMCEAYGQDYCSMMLKNFLSTRKYVVELTSTSWHEILSLFCKLFTNQHVKKMDKLMLSRIIRAVITGLTSQADIRPKKILAFFADFFSSEKAREHRSPSVLEQMLQALNTLLRAIGPQSRVQICKLGEDVGMTMLYLWKNMGSDQLKDYLIEFLQIEMWAHHPRGERRGSPGAFAVDWDKWASCLRSLYELFYREILELVGKTKTKEFILKPVYVDLAVDVCNQLFSDNVATVDVTQQSLLATADSQGAGPSAKKRRLESNWESIRGLISAGMGQTTKLLPWVQLITRLVEKYPGSLPQDELLPYLTCLSHTLSSAKRTDVTVYILRCLESFVSNWERLADTASDRARETEAVWGQVWSMTLRFVSLHHAEAGGYSLLTKILQKGLVSPGRELWSLFVPSVSTPVPQVVRFLISCLQACDLPENYVPKLVVTIQPSGEDTKFPLRKQLIDWLLPNREDEADLSQTGYNIESDWTAHLLVALTLRDPSALKNECQNNVDEISELERKYLEIKLQQPLAVEGKQGSGGAGKASCNVVYVATLLKEVEDKIQRDVQYYQGRNEQQLSELEEMVQYAEMISRLLSMLVGHRIVAPEILGSLDTSKHLTALIRKLTAAVLETVKREGHGKLVPVLLALQKLYSREPGGDRGVTEEVAGILRAATPAKLVDMLWDIVHEKHLSRTQSGDSAANQSRFNRSVSHGKRSRLLDDFDDDFDMDFDDQSNNNDDIDEGDGIDSQDSEELGSTEGSHSLLSSSALPESQVLRLHAIKLLCLWCCHGNTTVTVRSEVDVTYTRSKVIALVKDDAFDPTKPVELQQLQLIISEMTHRQQTLESPDLKIIISAIRNAAKQHRKDHEICCMCLSLLNKLVPSLAHTQAANIEESRESAMHLVQVFCDLQEKDNHSAPARLCLLELTEQLAKYDPKCDWSSLQQTAGQEDSGDMSGDGVVTPARMFIDYTVDLSYTVRRHVASTLHQLFVSQGNASAIQLEQKTQDEYLTQLYDLLNECLDIQGKLSAERLEDEVQCRTASVLLTLGTVICTSPVCEKKAVFTLLKMMRENDINKNMTHTILSKVASVLEFPCLRSFLESHLPFLVHNWLLLNYPIGDWPYQLLGCDQRKHFYRSYRDVIIPELVFTKNLEAVKAMAAELAVDKADLLRACVPKIVVHILPLFAASGLSENRDSENVKKRTNRARACYDLLAAELSQEVVDREIVNNLEDVVVNILMCLHDPDLDDGNIAHTNPEPNPPIYNTYIITSTLDYITKSFSGGGKTLVEILSKTPDSIQRILLELATSLFRSHRLAEKRRLLQAYQLFVRLLLKQFAGQLGGAWAYVLREVIIRLVYLIKEMTAEDRDCSTDKHYREAIACMSLTLLRDVCTVGVESCPKELMKYLPLLSSHLVTTVQLEGDIREQSASLLKFLVLEKAKPLRTAIAALDNFPSKPVFKDCSDMHRRLKYSTGPFTLTQEIEHFLSSGVDYGMESAPRLDGLAFLEDQLTANRDQIAALVNDGLLCRLLQELLQMTATGSRAVQLAACRCLGVIGPVDLNTICLPDRGSGPALQAALDTFQETPEAQKYCKIFHCLNGYLMDKSVPLVQCTSAVLKTLLSVKTGADFAAQYRAQLEDGEFLFHYLHPFRSGKKKAVKVKVPSRSWDNFLTTVDKESLWNPEHSNHSNWVKTLATTLITSGSVTDEILQLLEPVCSLKSDFSEAILPYLVHDILRSGDEGHREVLSRQMANFFSCHCGQASTRMSRCQSVASATTDEESICMNVKSVRVILSVVQYLRHQTRIAQGRVTLTLWDNNFWLDIDYLQVAMAAQYCSAHFSTLLYAEIWCDVQRDSTNRGGAGSSNSQSQGSQDTRMDTLSEASSSQSGLSVQDLLMEAYHWIGDPDGVYGCGAGRKADISSRVCTYELENQWDKAVIACDIQMDQSATSSQYDVLHALQSFGASHIFETYLQGTADRGDLPSLSTEVKELQFEACWKMGRWNIDTPNKLTDSMGFHECLYKGVKALLEEDLTFTQSALDKARLCTVAGISGGCLDAVGKLYPVLADLQCANILDTVKQRMLRKGKAGMDGVSLEDLSADNDFEFSAPGLYMACTAWHTLWQRSKHREAYSRYITSLQTLARCAREAGRHQICERAVQQLKGLTVGEMSVELDIQREEAQLFWSRGEFNIAKHLARGLLDKLKKLKREDEVAAKFYPGMLSLYGNWLAETRSENPNVIMEEYLEKTVALLEQSGDVTDTCMDAYLALARYADTQYQSIVDYMASSTFEAKHALMTKSKAEAERLRKLLGPSTKDVYLRTLEKQGNIDAQELKDKQEARARFLVGAVDGYIKCLRLGDAHGLRVFRLASLWFCNAGNEEVNQFMKEAVKSIQTYKWLPLMYQLAARMDIKPHGDTGEPFLKTLNQMIYKTAVSHPYHTLSCVLTLANAVRDKELEDQAKSSKRQGKLSKNQPPTLATEGRIQAAKQMIEKLRGDKKVGPIVKEMQTICDAYIQLANWNVNQFKTETKPIQLPAALWISQVKELKHVPVLTRDIKVDQSGCYENIPYVVKFMPTFKLAGGVNLPKIITCVGSDGLSSRQLVKGRDDLRQDAVMQQVFEMVNNLLQKDSEARKRKLHIRKYKVIPLSQRSGLLEWCEGTQPIGEYLIGSVHSQVKGAHPRYRPKDWLFNQCRKHLTEAAGNAKYKAYQEVCAKFQPVFRHFFLEKFSVPAVWFERRLAYTRSVATNSIVGYILGLGDRHVQNILIDCNSAELVHIDLGVAFEQGKILPVPETVPFRLTRDIEDAMGSCGVEGVFRRCCERTLEVMRTNQEALLTILEVLLYDPLQQWTISPHKAFELQQRRDRGNDTLDLTAGGDTHMEETDSAGNSTGETQESVNKLAERVLLRLRQKLQGVEDGAQLSLAGQVNHLIQEARNPKNLARLFAGWQPYI